ncbi:NAD-glutamate dehydrogenase [Dasania sp. GY-MA-18]|uniref:NAD-glutamate dehydrogenase n=1 Tax=Dasania phycosphaerae TaxID=2950436 RepID=A0A9J6RK04_9GAMM|nr:MULTISPECIES: NAD-glutamate dehydrogenase [Dasania]MCR8922261.1 NAD-glutamate dehydrogenase [Dasania sp. GY-MA-18]MCZ0864689.1 NAD-glutamate dehydrogenase [Dasania phycosphaerae]MCZ0868417.1 NAD-glutamate dehydrogenase [Dasania phycosphaerae]
MDTTTVAPMTKTEFSSSLNELIAKKLKAKEAKAVQSFAQHYYALTPLSELEGREWDDLFGIVYGWWNFIQNYKRKAPSITVFNPTVSEHSWKCGHTVIMAQMRDMPFLVDSLRMEINRRNIAIHSISSSVLTMVRDGKGELLEVLPNNDHTKSSKGRRVAKEALMYFEINLHTSEQEMKQLTKALGDVVKEVALAVDDYQPVLEQVQSTIANLSLAKAATDKIKEDISESSEFLQWMADGYFTFLGYSEYEFYTVKGKKYLREVTDSRLGLFKCDKKTDKSIAVDDFNPGMTRHHLSTQAIAFSKSSVRSRVHRPSYSDYIVVKKYDSKGNVCGECRYLGLYTSPVYLLSPTKIPLIRKKYDEVIKRSGMDPNSYEGKLLRQTLETFPRDELFQSGSSELYETALETAFINERHMVRLFMRKDSYGKFVTSTVYVPRDVFSSDIRKQIQQLISKEIEAEENEFTTHFSESILVRSHIVFKVNPDKPVNYDVKALEQKIIDLTRTWNDHLLDALCATHGEEKGTNLYNDYSTAFRSSYKENFDAQLAVDDIEIINTINDNNKLAMSFYQYQGADEDDLRFKVFSVDDVVELSDVVPVLENLGLRVVGEHPYKVTRKDGSTIWIHDFFLVFGLPVSVDVEVAKSTFQEAFAAVWFGESDSDAFNRLVLGARLNWREVALLRTYANYMKQTMFNFPKSYLANTLSNHLDITRNLVALFKSMFDPRVNRLTEKSSDRIERLKEKIESALESVDNLDEDRIFRRYLEMISATLRTNFYQDDSEGKHKPYISIKLSPKKISNIPEPRPLYEIFVYSPRVEGVHLRGGKVARGGLRWSDRLQDYRTEVLGLVKAQQVKNAVIVPSGAKGGFVAKQLPTEGGREAFMKEGIACYKMFIRGLLDVTDNLSEGGVVPPEQVVRMDKDDPYLVVAADKGTATFSDIANSLSAEYGFWLGDAFASGGSQGYDHKGMGITARGAWVSVQRHFKEKGLNVQTEDFSVIGIGDMAGDVFGNGMLMSEHIKLVAAFNHMHIFIDPDPDPAKSFIERQRLFNTPGTNWEDYNKKLISKGGGIFNRSAKSLTITKEMRATFAIKEKSLTPTDLINRLLKAPVDLIWNGGIGTYVKSAKESHAEVGDKANDNLRVNGNELRCKVFGEGGNLGLTQLGRIEFCLNGGACNTDFIDNSAGVDCSDHEVNIKILLNEIVAKGGMTETQRNKLLVKMTDNVSEMVLANNYRQTQAISLAEHQGRHRVGEYRRFIIELEEAGQLSRELEFLPSDEELSERYSENKLLTRPELSVLISYAKVQLKESLSQSDVSNDPYVVKYVENAFPTALRKKYNDNIYAHRLRKEIVATQVANDMVNIMGITFCQRLMAATGCKPGHVAKAYITAKDIYHLEDWWSEIEKLDYEIAADLQMTLMGRISTRVRRATRWFLRNRRGSLNPQQERDAFEKPLHEIIEVMPGLLRGEQKKLWQKEYDELKEQGLSDAMARRAASPIIQSGLNMVEAARLSGESATRVAETYFSLGDRLGFHWFAGQISEVGVENYWQAMAREAFMDDLESQVRTIVVSVLNCARSEQDVDEAIDQWQQQHRLLVERWLHMINELKNATGTDFAMFSVALRELLDLAQVSHHCRIDDAKSKK